MAQSFALNFASERFLRYLDHFSDGIFWASVVCKLHLGAKDALFTLARPAMAWLGRLRFVGGFDPLFGAMGLTCCKNFSTKCSWLVSSLGRCRNASGRLTFGTLRSTGYRVVGIQGHFFFMHRLVAFAFLESPAEPLAWYVHHCDGDASNNRLDNLMYLTQSRNVQLSYDTNPERGRAGKAVSVPVMWRIRGQTTGWNTCPSISAAAEELRVSPFAISKHCRQGTPIQNYEVVFARPAEPEVLENEEWLPMKNPKTGLDVPGRQVSSCGRMKSSNGVITRGHQSKSGYVRTVVRDCKDQRNVAYIHSLVAYNFIGAPPSSQHNQVNHKDLNPGNNHVENLEYVTPSENIRHFHASRGYQQSKPCKQKPVLGRPCGGSEDEWVWYKSMADAAKVLGTNVTGISRCTRGLSQHAGGYEFRLAEPDEPLQLPGEEWRPVDLEGLLRELYTDEMNQDEQMQSMMTF